jgi:hypothetical protein
MDATNLMAKLVEIERAVAGAGLAHVHTLALDAQQSLLHLEEQLMETLLENQRLLEFLQNGTLDPESLADFAAGQDGDANLSRFSSRFAADPARRKTRPYWIN